MGISFRTRGSFKKTEKFLKKSLGIDFVSILEKYGKLGVDELMKNTPVDSGETKYSWKYDVKKTKYGYSIIWSNENIKDGVNIAVILQYGHATRNGGYVDGVDYINPALKPIFEGLAKKAWKEVSGR